MLLSRKVLRIPLALAVLLILTNATLWTYISIVLLLLNIEIDLLHGSSDRQLLVTGVPFTNTFKPLSRTIHNLIIFGVHQVVPAHHVDDNSRRVVVLLV